MSIRFLITGVAGFVGRHMVEYLSAAYPSSHIWGVDMVESTDIGWEKPNFKYMQMNLLDKDKVTQLLRTARPNRIIHLASFSSVSYSWENPSEIFINNCLIFINLAEATKSECFGCRILSVGSSEEYGSAVKANTMFVETDPLSPSSPYAVARVSQELLSRVFASGYGLDIVITRSFNHIGPHQRNVFVIPSFARQFVRAEKEGRRKLDLVCGDIDVVRDFTDVRDVVRAYDLLLQKGEQGEIYNVCSGKGHRIRDVISVMEKLTSLEVSININKDFIRPLEIRELVGDNHKIRQRCGWKPQRELESSVSDVLDYWRGVEEC